MSSRPLTALSLSLLIVSCSCAEAPSQENPADAESAAPSPGAVPVARSGGGTSPLPLGDRAALRRMQGLGVTPAPTITLTHPQSGAVLEPGELAVSYEIADYEVGEAEELRRHVHVILDDRPYHADYSETGSITFPAEELTPGTHLLTVFLARDIHLSLKNPEASDHAVFHVGEASAEGGVAPEAPTLVYSRPKGEYSRADGSARNILLDFYLLNASLGPEGYTVRATVDGGPPTLIQDWWPRIVLTDPAPGEHSVRLELLDAQGNAVAGPTNDTTRTITITE